MFELNLEMYFSLISNFFCKLRKYFAYSDHAITGWLMVIISFDRYLSISYPTRFLFRKKKLFQIMSSFFVIGFNYCLYIPYWCFYIKEIVTNKSLNQTKMITYKCVSPGIWAELLNLFQECLIPFSLMFLFTILTIRTVSNSRSASSNNSRIVKQKDFKFMITLCDHVRIR